MGTFKELIIKRNDLVKRSNELSQAHAGEMAILKKEIQDIDKIIKDLARSVEGARVDFLGIKTVSPPY